MTSGEHAFSALGARSRTLVVALSVVLVVESAALHALLYRRWPWVSVLLLLANAYTIWWLVRDYRAMADRPTIVRDDGVHIRLGARADGTVPWSQVAAVTRPTWQEIPEPATAGYLKLSGMDDPNVLLRLTTAVPFRLVLGVKKPAQLVGLRLDDPEGFIDAVRARLQDTSHQDRVEHGARPNAPSRPDGRQHQR